MNAVDTRADVDVDLTLVPACENGESSVDGEVQPACAAMAAFAQRVECTSGHKRVDLLCTGHNAQWVRLYAEEDVVHNTCDAPDRLLSVVPL